MDLQAGHQPLQNGRFQGFAEPQQVLGIGIQEQRDGQAMVIVTVIGGNYFKVILFHVAST